LSKITSKKQADHSDAGFFTTLHFTIIISEITQSLLTEDAMKLSSFFFV